MPDILLRGQHGTYAFNPYNRANLLGEGGMGRVFLGVNVTTRRRVAVKVVHKELTANEQVVQRAAREASLQFNHPNLVKMLDFVPVNGIYHLIAEYIDGQTLEQRIHENRQPAGVSPVAALGGADGTVRQVIVPLLDALAFLHSQQPPIVHRDVKPSNLMLTPAEGAGFTLKLMDLGVASIAGGRRMTQAGVKLGTPHYSAPEQIRGERDRIGPATDLYAVGITLYELLTGKVPFDAPSDYDVMEMQVKMPLPPHPALSPGLFAVIRKATEKDPAHRYASATDMKQALLAALGSGSATAPLSFWARLGLFLAVLILLRLLVRALFE